MGLTLSLLTLSAVSIGGAALLIFWLSVGGSLFISLIILPIVTTTIGAASVGAGAASVGAGAASVGASALSGVGGLSGVVTSGIVTASSTIFELAHSFGVSINFANDIQKLIKNPDGKLVKEHLLNCKICRLNLKILEKLIPPSEDDKWWGLITKNQFETLKSYAFPWDAIRTVMFPNKDDKKKNNRNSSCCPCA